MAKWIEHLEEEDQTFLKRFVLASGSLKDLATQYGISYPTVRLRLDRLIEKIKLLDSTDIKSEFERMLRLQLVEGKLDPSSFKALLAAHRREMEGSHESRSAGHPAGAQRISSRGDAEGNQLGEADV